jgi:hypothetical protein
MDSAQTPPYSIKRPGMIVGLGRSPTSAARWALDMWPQTLEGIGESPAEACSGEVGPPTR